MIEHHPMKFLQDLGRSLHFGLFLVGDPGEVLAHDFGEFFNQFPSHFAQPSEGE